MNLGIALFDHFQAWGLCLIWSIHCNKVQSFAISAFTSSVPIATKSNLLYTRSLYKFWKNRTKIRNMHVLGFYPVR